MSINTKKALFNNWVNNQYKIILKKDNNICEFKKKLYQKINVIIRYLIKDISYYDKTEKQKKQILFEYFLSELKEKKILLKKEIVKDKNFQNNYTAKERIRIIKNSNKKTKKNCFYLTNRWLVLKAKVRNLYKCGCMKCGKTNCEIHIDHIFPRSTYPELQYNFNNLQILCKECNEEKSNFNTIDYRTAEQIKLCSINNF